MAANLLHSLANDNPDLQKQIGCMTGIFQVFDHQHFVSGKRPNQSVLLPPSSGNSKFSEGSLNADSTYPHIEELVERKSNKYVNEKQVSMESSRLSFSSSPCSSSSSSMDHIISLETPSRDSIICETNACLGMGRLSADLRDVVKDSMYKDSRRPRTLKRIDSPRPLHFSKSENGLVEMKGKKDAGNDFEEFLKALLDVSMSKDARRLSYDGREVNHKIKDLPRLSLDLRGGSAKNQTRPSGVVVKLMGLEMMPKKNPDEVMKPICSAKFPIEPAPWKQMDSFRGPPRQSSSLSNSLVHGEIQRTLRDVERLEESEKDLRALKQILEAMQTKGIFEGSKEELYSRLKSIRDDDQRFRLDTNARMNSKLRGSKSSKLVKKSGNSPSSINSASSKMTKDQTVKESCKEQATTDRRTNNRNLRVTQTSPRLPQVSNDKSLSSLLKLGSISPREQQKKLEFDKRSRSPNPLLDSNKIKRQPSKLPIGSGSPGGRRRSLLCQEEMRSRLSEEDVVDLSITPEQPSPVSVLDTSVYVEESPSPVKKKSHALEGNEISWDSSDFVSTKTTVLELPSKIIRKKLQRIDILVQKLRQLNSTHDESHTDYIASLCENSNPDDRYICEILITSGFLLRDLSKTAFELHPSGHPINPQLFTVLEQTKGENSAHGVALTKTNPEKLHRKVIFDVVNEILLGKLNPPSETWLKPNKLAKKTLNAQMLLKEVCGEVKNKGFSILEDDVMNGCDKWVDFRSDISSIVLDVERSIFKELVKEIVIGEGTLIRGGASACSRRLFSS